MPRLVTAHSNETIKRLRALREKKHRVESGRFLAEGLRICTEALDAGQVPETVVFGSEHAGHPLVRRLIAAVEGAGGEAIETSGDILSKLSGKDNPGAVVGVFRERRTALADLDRSRGLFVVCESLRDPGNLGTILRTCDATGAGGLILIDRCCDPWSAEAVRASMGALFTVPVAQAEWAEFLGWLQGGPGQLVGAVLGDSEDYQAVRYVAPTFVLMGGEQAGLPEAYAAACDARARIPMLGKADSLNVAVACAVLLYEVVNQRRVHEPSSPFSHMR